MNKLILVMASWAVPTLSMAESNRFNPNISLILQGQYADYQQDPSSYALPGFMLGGEAGLAKSGLGLGHNELVMSASVDQYATGKLSLAIAEHDGATEVELEEAFVETLGLGKGITVKAGRFMSNLGYLNNQHSHSWDFIDSPLVYRALFGNQLIDDGIQLRWIAPTDLFIQLGAEIGRGERFPSGGARKNGKGSHTLFMEFGGDIGTNHSWQAGISHWSSAVSERLAGGHDHGGNNLEIPSFDGSSKLSALDLVWKWAPKGNSQQQSFKMQFEYFMRDEQGDLTLLGSDPLEQTSYQGKQKGWYSQAIYQFAPGWRTGIRYDQLHSSNHGNDVEVLSEVGLTSNGHQPHRSSIMLDYAPSEFSQIRLQYNRDVSRPTADNQWYVQYVMSLGAHGAHQF